MAGRIRYDPPAYLRLVIRQRCSDLQGPLHGRVEGVNADVEVQSIIGCSPSIGSQVGAT